MMSRIPLWVRIAASLLLLVLCVAVVDLRAVGDALLNLPAGVLALSLLYSTIGTVLAKAWIAHETTRASGLSLSFATLVRINLVARFYSVVLPRGAATVVRWYHYRAGGSGAAASALLLFENLVSVATLFASAAVLLTLEAIGTEAFVTPLLWPALAGAVLSVAALLPFLHGPSSRISGHVLQPIVRRGGWFAGPVSALLSAVSNYQRIRLLNVGSIFTASAVGYVFFVLSVWVLADAMDLGVGIVAIAWIRSATLLVALVPITVAGLGLREVSFIALLGTYGVDPSAAFALAMASFAVQVVIASVGGGLELERVVRSRRGKKVAKMDPR